MFGILLNQLWQIFKATGQIFIDVNGPILKNNIAIWSHCNPSWAAMCDGMLMTTPSSNHDFRVFERPEECESDSAPRCIFSKMIFQCNCPRQCDQIGQILSRLWQFLEVCLVYDKNLNLLCKIYNTIWPMFIVVNGQIWDNNLAIWSHRM